VERIQDRSLDRQLWTKATETESGGVHRETLLIRVNPEEGDYPFQMTRAWLAPARFPAPEGFDADTHVLGALLPVFLNSRRRLLIRCPSVTGLIGAKFATNCVLLPKGLPRAGLVNGS
jgi:hypothetical protein